MPRQALVYKILIASPSDVKQERRAIPEVIHAWNVVNSATYGVMLEPVLWETHATPEMGTRPQAIINKQLVENSDILIGVFWTRLGTQTGQAESGTVEEIEEFRKAGKPVLLYFSSVPVIPESVNPDQYKKLQELKGRYEKEGLISVYDNLSALRDQLHRHITYTIRKLHEGITEDDWALASKSVDNERSALEMFKAQFGSFLRRLEAEWSAEYDSGPVNIDDGRFILERACDDVLDFRSQVIEDKGTNLVEVLTDSINRLKAIQHHQVYADGGKSYRAFWEEGDQIIALLKEALGEIDKAIGAGNFEVDKGNTIEEQKVEPQDISMVMNMRRESADQRQNREAFWSFLRKLYNIYRECKMKLENQTLPDSFNSLIKEEQETSFPPKFDPTKEDVLLSFVKENEHHWKSLKLWELARFAYPSLDDITGCDKVFFSRLRGSHAAINSQMFRSEFEAHHKLACFWDNWSSIAGIDAVRKHLDPNWIELVILTWLELALVRKTDDISGRSGKRGLFVLAKAEWESANSSLSSDVLEVN